VPLGAVPIEIGLKSLAGINRFEIRLDPAELGRIDVRLEIGEAGDVKAHLTVDRVETLALLQRDARTLERAFEQAGLKPSEGGVNLSLRDSSGDGRPQDQARDERGPPHNPNPRTAVSERPEAASAAPVRTWRGVTGVDLRI
jgi:flagellar hook-length control protein FliK